MGRQSSEVKPAGLERTTPPQVLLALKFGSTLTLNSAGMGEGKKPFRCQRIKAVENKQRGMRCRSLKHHARQQKME